MKTRRNMWPFGTNQPLGPVVSYGKRRPAPVGRSRASSPAQEKAAAAAKRAAKLDDPALERKLKAHYAKGGNLNEFLQANPGAVPKCHLCHKPLKVEQTLHREPDGGIVHDLCWRRRNPSKATAEDRERRAQEKHQEWVSAQQKKMVAKWNAEFARQAAAKKRSNAARNAGRGMFLDSRVIDRAVKSRYPSATGWTNHNGKIIVDTPSGEVVLTLRQLGIRQPDDDYYTNPAKGKRNPSAAAADVYEEFHGMPSAEIVEVTKRVHFHEHLAALGKLEALVVQRNGNEHRLVGFKGAKLCCNERKNQLFVEGGDQALDASDFGFKGDWPHEKNTLGPVTRLEYFTTKKHLGSEGGTAIYFHLPAEPERGRSAGTGPDLIYDAVNESLEFAGGTYEILAEGISR